MLSVSWKQSMYAWCGLELDVAEAEFRRLFERKIILHGDVYFQDHERACQELLRRAKGRGFHYQEGVTLKDINPEHTLCPSSLRALQVYREKFADVPHAVVDLEQNPCFRASNGELFPCMVTHGTHWSLRLGRPATSREMFSALGMQVMSAAESFFYPDAVLDALDFRQAARLAGNGMCLHPAAAFFFWVLGNLARRDTPVQIAVGSELSAEQEQLEDSGDES